jgi:hypothetical protein
MVPWLVPEAGLLSSAGASDSSSIPFGSGKVGERHFGESALLCFLGIDVSEVELVTCDTGASGCFSSFVFDHFFETVESVSGATDFGDHTGGHFIEIGHCLGDFHVIKVATELLDTIFGGLDADVAGFHEFLVAGVGGLHLLTNFVVFLIDGLQLKGELTGGFTVACFEIGGGLGTEFAFLFVEFLGSGNQFFDHAGVGGEAFIKLGNLRAEVFLLVGEECFRVPFFESADEEPEEAFDEIFDTFKH